MGPRDSIRRRKRGFRDRLLDGLVEGKLANNGLESVHIFAFRETKDVVFAESPAIERETIAESAQIIEEVHCLVLWHGDPEFVAVLHD